MNPLLNLSNYTALAAAISLLTVSSNAQTIYLFTQTTGGQLDWTDGTNWSGGVAPNPVAGDTIQTNLAMSAETFLNLESDRTFENWNASFQGFGSRLFNINSGHTITLATGTSGNVPTFTINGGGAARITIDAAIAGSDGLKKSGDGTLVLNNMANTFSGGVELNGGALHIAEMGALGDVSNNLTVTANSTFQMGNNTVFDRELALNNGATLNFNQGDNTIGVINGAITGDGGIEMSGSGFSAFHDLRLASTNNTFTGNVVIGVNNDGNKSLTVNSLADSVGSTLEIRSSNKGTGLKFALGDGATSALVLDNRQVILTGNQNRNVTIENQNSDTAVTININQDIINTQTTSRNLVLTGINEGDNTIAAISNGASSSNVISLVKNGTGKWILTGANTFTGNTTVNAGELVLADTGELRFVIGASGINNALLGSANASLLGDFVFDLTLAGTAIGDSWTIVGGSLNETFGSTFGVRSTNGAFTDNGNGTWSIAENDVLYNFSQLDGTLSISVVPEPGTFALIGGFLALTSVMLRRRR